ncbi:hypothetical protein ACFXDA_27645, partial [Streptomyces sp. NPDC059389]
MEFAVFATLPGLVVVLTAVAFADQLLLRAGRAGVLPWRNSVRTGQVSARREAREGTGEGGAAGRKAWHTASFWSAVSPLLPSSPPHFP